VSRLPACLTERRRSDWAPPRTSPLRGIVWAAWCCPLQPVGLGESAAVEQLNQIGSDRICAAPRSTIDGLHPSRAASGEMRSSEFKDQIV
jgi:hypothetical protein